MKNFIDNVKMFAQNFSAKGAVFNKTMRNFARECLVGLKACLESHSRRELLCGSLTGTREFSKIFIKTKIGLHKIRNLIRSEVHITTTLNIHKT